MADQRIQYTEYMVGAGHPTKEDTLNRHANIEHNTDGTHKMTGGAAGVLYYHDGTMLVALPAGATTEILVGGGAGAPAWTTATGSGAPVRQTSPTLVTPALGTPASGDLKNCTNATEANKGATIYAGTTKALAGTDTQSAMTPADVAAVKVDERTHDVINIVEDLSYLPPVAFTWDPGSLADGAGETSAAVPYPDVTLGGVSIQAIAPYSLQGITCNAYVDAANSCKVRLQNETGGTIDLASGTWTLQARRV